MEKHYILTAEEKENSRFGKLVFEFPEERNEVVAEGDPVDFVVKPQAYFRGACQIPGAEFNQSYQIFVKPFFLDRVQHRHAKDEYLVFLGASFPNVFDFDARIEFTLGKGEQAETFVITKPTIVRIPAGTWHCPLNFIRIDRTIFLQVALLQGAFGGTYMMPDGVKELWYNGQINCILDPEKKCDTCQKCLTIDWNK